jgi:hypothetical protein
MKIPALLILIAVAHAGFLFGAYGTGFFGLGALLPYMGMIAIWLGASSLLAGYAYFKASTQLPWLSSPARGLSFALAATAISLYIGVYLAFNTYGT